ncbi:MAG: tetratricopeptide repeat protein [Acidobacteria bacterium]|nr:tetratricopeptide repeat protein [Acidobacteriota bacterium]
MRAISCIFALILAVVWPSWALGAEEDTGRWESAVAARGIDPAGVIYPFGATPEMQEWARQQMEGAGPAGPLKQLKILQRSLFDRENFEFEYDGFLTLSAEDAFAQRRGNCMAFTALFIAMARSLGIPAVLVSVQKVPDVQRIDGLVVVNRHVVAGYRGANELNLFDFYVTSSAPTIHQRIISDVRASAMHHTNRGGLALREGDLIEARRHFELSVLLAPEWAPGWVNLGVVEYREGRTAQALNAYAKALEAEPSNSSALTNIAGIHRDQGHDEAARSALAAAARQTRNPFTLIAMADIEMHNGNLGKARSYLRRARWWFSSEPEVYMAMARLARVEGDDKGVTRHLARAAKLREAE